MTPDPRFDLNRSVWMPAEAPAPRAPLKERLQVDIAIIGGGFTGMSCAWHLSERFPDHEILLLEAVRLANGASGRNGGMMLGWNHGIDDGDLDRVRRSHEAGLMGMEIIENILETCDAGHLLRRNGSMDVFMDPRDADAAAQECARLQEAGVDIRFLEAAEVRRRLGISKGEGAQFDPSAGQLDGYGMIQAMAGVLEGRGVRIHEGSPVRVVEEGPSITLTLDGGQVSAGSVFLGTNAYTPSLGYFRNEVFALHSHVVGSAPRSMEEWARLGWNETFGFADDSDRIAYGSINPRGQLVFGGGSNRSYTYRYGGATAIPAETPEATAAVREKLCEYFPQFKDLELTHAWSGPLGITLSRIPTMGVRGEHRNLYYAVGFSGHGITLANLAGRVLCDLYSGDAGRWEGLSFFGRGPYPIPPEPLRWVGYQIYTRLTGRSPRRRMVQR